MIILPRQADAVFVVRFVKVRRKRLNRLCSEAPLFQVPHPTEPERIKLQAVMDQRVLGRVTVRRTRERGRTLPSMRDIVGGVTVETAATQEVLAHGRFALTLQTLKQRLLPRRARFFAQPCGAELVEAHSDGHVILLGYISLYDPTLTCWAIVTCTVAPGRRSFRTCANALMAMSKRPWARSCRCCTQDSWR